MVMSFAVTKPPGTALKLSYYCYYSPARLMQAVPSHPLTPRPLKLVLAVARTTTNEIGAGEIGIHGLQTLTIGKDLDDHENAVQTCVGCVLKDMQC
jgi:hypothetical protein